MNSSLQVLRRILHFAAEWGAIEKAPKIKLYPANVNGSTLLETKRRLGISRRVGPLGVRCHGVGRYRNAARRVLSLTLGSNHLDKW